jgi:hypothetical protein
MTFDPSIPLFIDAAKVSSCPSPIPGILGGFTVRTLDRPPVSVMPAPAIRSRRLARGVGSSPVGW